MRPDPPDRSDPERLKRIRTALESSGYDAQAVGVTVTSEALTAFTRGWHGPAMRRTSGGTGLDTLIRLFALGLDVDKEDLAEVPEAEISDWKDAGLVRVYRGVVRPLVAIHAGQQGGRTLFITSDSGRAGAKRRLFADFVIDLDISSAQLSAMTPRRPFERALDLGTGSGLQAILASTHCDKVVATDLNGRALAFAAFNLALNEIDNVELRAGDLYEPVSGEAFDLIVSNPPFVVSPSFEHYFRDSRLPGDGISQAVVRGAAQHLGPGGWATLKCQWVIIEGQDWRQRLRDWVGDTGCDMLILTARVDGPLAHATRWLNDLGQVEPDEADKRLAQWTRYFDDEGVTAVVEGFVVLRKGAGGRVPWVAIEELSRDVTSDRTGALGDLFDSQDWIVERSQAGGLLGARFRLPESVHLQRASRSEGGRWIEDGVVLYKAGGLHANIHLHDPAAEAIAACDGTKTLEDRFDSAVQHRGLPVSMMDSRYTSIRSEFEELVRRLVLTGFLEPVQG